MESKDYKPKILNSKLNELFFCTFWAPFRAYKRAFKMVCFLDNVSSFGSETKMFKFRELCGIPTLNNIVI